VVGGRYILIKSNRKIDSRGGSPRASTRSPEEKMSEQCDAMMIKNMKPVKKADHFVEVIGKTDEHLAKLLEYEHQNFID
jgi:hypothetical protein